jgi:hypothetical protein
MLWTIACGFGMYWIEMIGSDLDFGAVQAVVFAAVCQDEGRLLPGNRLGRYIGFWQESAVEVC